MDKWLIKGQNKNKRDNPKLERKRKPEEISEASTSSAEADAAPGSRSASGSLTTSQRIHKRTCVDRVLEQYIPLRAYLTEAVFSDPSKTTKEMLMTMNNQFTVVYLEFMSYVLSLVTNFNTLFQSETSLLHKLKPEVENLLKTLSANFMKISYVKSCANILNADFRNATHILGLDEMNIGVKAGESMENLKKDKNVPRAAIADFYKTCQELYIELTSDITQRFDFRDPLFSIISALNSSEAQHFKIKSPKRFPVVNKFVTTQKLDDEWRAHAMLNFAQHGFKLHGDNIDAECYW
ncbi:hypothetical protein ILUMI_11289, partial [Ignelater luminosus]